MISSKDRTIEKKRRQQATGAKRTERSRARRVKNKHRREEIHAIDPDMKVVVVNQKTFDEYGTEIKIVDGAIKAAESEIITESADFDSAVVEYQEVIDKEHQVVEEIKTKNKSALQRLTDKFKKG